MTSTQKAKYRLQFYEAFPRAFLSTCAFIYVWASHATSTPRCRTPYDSNGEVMFELLTESRSPMLHLTSYFDSLRGYKLL